ncbi:MAG: hypothetical protein EOL91_01135 [Actinobacteria bacterium]|nr:hypothetical protein [Actinomycetota bacterium]
MKRVRWAVALLIVVVVVVAVALAFGGGDDSPTAGPTTPAIGASPSATPTPEPTTASATVAPVPVSIARTSDADAYASSVAAFLFSMDTRTTSPEDYRNALLAEADPLMSDTGLADLELMVDERLPETTQWARMQANQQVSQWTPTTVWEPQTWAEVVTDGLAEPGWVMRNVTGTQTTYYLDGGEYRTAVSEPTVTIGMRCPAPDAAVERCHLTLIGTTVLP